jgi:hypothetical protein
MLARCAVQVLEGQLRRKLSAELTGELRALFSCAPGTYLLQHAESGLLTPGAVAAGSLSRNPSVPSGPTLHSGVTPSFPKRPGSSGGPASMLLRSLHTEPGTRASGPSAAAASPVPVTSGRGPQLTTVASVDSLASRPVSGAVVVTVDAEALMEGSQSAASPRPRPASTRPVTLLTLDRVRRVDRALTGRVDRALTGRVDCALTGRVDRAWVVGGVGGRQGRQVL